MRYYIADLHFGHGTLNDHMDCRGFSSTEEMNQHMIDQWNSRVRSNDEVVILGDFCISTTGKEVNEILARLKGRKYLIVGNHDKYIERRSFDRSAFKWIENYKELKDNKRRIILSHYPIMCYNGQYHFDGDGGGKTYMLYGHVHNTYDEILINNYINEVKAKTRYMDTLEREVTIPCQMINCFCMFSDYVPLTLDEWIEVDKERRERTG